VARIACRVLYIQTDIHVQYCTCRPIYMYRTVHTDRYTCTVLYMQTDIHVQYCTSRPIYMYSTVHADRYTCTVLYMQTDIHVQYCTCRPIYMYSTVNADRYTCTVLHMQTDIHVQYCTCRPIYMYHCISPNYLCNERCFRHKVIHKFKTRVLGSVTFFFLENRAFMRQCEKNTVQPDRPQMIILAKTTNTYSEYEYFFAFPPQK